MSRSCRKRAFSLPIAVVVATSVLGLFGCKDNDGSSSGSSGGGAGCSTPTIALLGDGPATYNLPAGAHSLIVKRFGPFRFEIITAPSFTSTVVAAPFERVWSCTNAPCTTEVPQAGVASLPLGMLTAGTTYLIPVLDNDVDPQIPEIRDSMGNVVQVLPDFGLTTVLTFVPASTDTFTLFNVDTVGNFTPCAQ